MRFRTTLLIAMMASLGCRSGGAEDRMGQASLLRPDALVFADASDGARYRQVRADALGRGWRAAPVMELGNFVEERWCSAEISEAECVVGRMSAQRNRGAAWMFLRTHSGRERPPAVFGLNINATDTRGPMEVSASLRLSNRMSWKVGDKDVIAVVVPGGNEDEAAAGISSELAALLRSPDSFRDRAKLHVGALTAEVTRVLTAHEAYRCEYPMSAYKNDGKPPPCKPIPLTVDEERVWVEKASAHFGALEALIEREGPSLHSALSAVLPPAIWAP